MKTVIEMAIEAELIYNEEGWCGWVEDTDLRPFIERFAELVRADEREQIIATASDLNYWDDSEKLIEAIRARSNA